MFKRAGFFLVLVFVGLGCLFQTPSCDDENPCTHDAYNESLDACVHINLYGNQSGCDLKTGCIEYGCVEGNCLSHNLKDCCGNQVCEAGESSLNCVRDCSPTCFDGVRNQGEDDVDCGGPCPGCGVDELGYLNYLDETYLSWINLTESYKLRIQSYNRRRDLSALSKASVKTLSQAKLRLKTLNQSREPEGLSNAKNLLMEAMTKYVKSLDKIVLFCQSRSNRYLKASNKLREETYEWEKKYISERNRFAQTYNQIQVQCSNHVRDGGEEGIDCGGVCAKGCEKTYNVTKIITIRNHRGGVRLKVNVSAPAIHYPPYQRVYVEKTNPKPDAVHLDGRGNKVYVFKLDLGSFEAGEILMNYEVTVRGGLRGGVVDESRPRIHEDELTKLSEEICSQGRKFQAGDTHKSVLNIHNWISDNIRYSYNTQQYSTPITFEMRAGACDEQARLFTAFAGCLGIPARLVSGYLVNNSKPIGHAWSQYYADGGWHNIDPTSDGGRGLVSDTRHILSCIGKSNKQCSTKYYYTYGRGEKPDIEFREEVFIS
ncbi:MAG: hypothetical protein GF334_11770 [Candidatus Altiarchaeales archaeon]|nr:hypothetical protein [Candidatus Altiarchaeales archaeon]